MRGKCKLDGDGEKFSQPFLLQFYVFCWRQFKLKVSQCCDLLYSFFPGLFVSSRGNSFCCWFNSDDDWSLFRSGEWPTYILKSIVWFSIISFYSDSDILYRKSTICISIFCILFWRNKNTWWNESNMLLILQRTAKISRSIRPWRVSEGVILSSWFY